MRRLRNLWAWSNISPYEAGQAMGQSTIEVLKDILSPKGGEIVFPIEDKPHEDIATVEDLDKALDDITF